MDITGMRQQVEYKRDLVRQYEVAAVCGKMTRQALQMYEGLRDDLEASTEEYAALRMQQEVLARGG